MSHTEYIDWAAFAQVEPLPAARSDLHTALLLFMYATLHRKKGSKKFKVEQFLSDWWGTRRDPRALAAKFRVMTENLQEEEEGPEGNGKRTRDFSS